MRDAHIFQCYSTKLFEFRQACSSNNCMCHDCMCMSNSCVRNQEHCSQTLHSYWWYTSRGYMSLDPFLHRTNIVTASHRNIQPTEGGKLCLNGPSFHPWPMFNSKWLHHSLGIFTYVPFVFSGLFPPFWNIVGEGNKF